MNAQVTQKKELEEMRKLQEKKDMLKRTLTSNEATLSSRKLEKGEKKGRRGKADGEPRTGAKANKEAMAAIQK